MGTRSLSSRAMSFSSRCCCEGRIGQANDHPVGWSGEMLRKTYDRPQPLLQVATTVRTTPVRSPRTQRGVIGPRCRADWVIGYPLHGTCANARGELLPL